MSVLMDVSLREQKTQKKAEAESEQEKLEKNRAKKHCNTGQAYVNSHGKFQKA